MFIVNALERAFKVLSFLFVVLEIKLYRFVDLYLHISLVNVHVKMYMVIFLKAWKALTQKVSAHVIVTFSKFEFPKQGSSGKWFLESIKIDFLIFSFSLHPWT